LENLSTTSDETSSSGCDKTSLLSSGGVSSDSRWVTNMLMVTSTMRMLDWVHSDTSDSWPVLSLSSGLEPGVSGLEEWLVGSLSTGDDSNHGSAGSNDGLSGTGWKSDSSFLTIIGVTNNDSGSSGGSGERSSVSEFSLTVRDDGTLWHAVDWKNISNRERGY
jgi:hypothetical protein